MKNEKFTSDEKPTLDAKGVERAIEVFDRVLSGRAKYESLNEACLYADVHEPPEVVALLKEKWRESCKLLRQLANEHMASGGTLFPGITTENVGKAYDEIEVLARTNPGTHPVLLKIAELDRFKYLVGQHDAGAKLN